MGLVQRVKNILMMPAAEWAVIERESTSPGKVLIGYVLPLALAGAAATIIGERMALVRLDYQIDLPVSSTLLRAVGGVIATLAVCAITALLVDALAPSFGGTKSLVQAFKLVAYAFTPALVAELARVIPFVGGLAGIIGLIYSIYVLYLGIPVLMKCPADRAAPYTAVTVGGAILGLWIVTMILGLLLITGTMFTDNPFRIV